MEGGEDRAALVQLDRCSLRIHEQVGEARSDAEEHIGQGERNG
jgi:hypothetical protein